MNFVNPTAQELAGLRPDPLLFEQELDIRPALAESLERELGFRAGRRYWRSASGHLYAIDLADLGRGRPSMAFVYGFWPRFAPRPVDDEVINHDLSDFCVWVADVCDGIEKAHVSKVLEFAWAARSGGKPLLG
jgi:hypothetical protein